MNCLGKVCGIVRSGFGLEPRALETLIRRGVVHHSSIFTIFLDARVGWPSLLLEVSGNALGSVPPRGSGWINDQNLKHRGFNTTKMDPPATARWY